MKKPINPYQEIKGASLVEFALIFPLFFGVLFTVIQICLVFVDKASINIVTEELLLDYATTDDIPLTNPADGYFDDLEAVKLKVRFEDQLAAVQIKYTDPITEYPPKHLIKGRICRPNLTSPIISLRNFESTSPRDKNVLMSLTVIVPIKCLMGEITFGLTGAICEHRKSFYRILPLNPLGYPDC